MQKLDAYFYGESALQVNTGSNLIGIIIMSVTGFGEIKANLGKIFDSIW